MSLSVEKSSPGGAGSGDHRCSVARSRARGSPARAAEPAPGESCSGQSVSRRSAAASIDRRDGSTPCGATGQRAVNSSISAPERPDVAASRSLARPERLYSVRRSSTCAEPERPEPPNFGRRLCARAVAGQATNAAPPNVSNSRRRIMCLPFRCRSVAHASRPGLALIVTGSALGGNERVKHLGDRDRAAIDDDPKDLSRHSGFEGRLWVERCRLPAEGRMAGVGAQTRRSGWRGRTAVVGGQPSFADARASDCIAPKAAVRVSSIADRLTSRTFTLGLPRPRTPPQ